MNQFTKSIPIIRTKEKLPSSSRSTWTASERQQKKNQETCHKRMTEKEVINKYVKDGDYLGFELYGRSLPDEPDARAGALRQEISASLARVLTSST